MHDPLDALFWAIEDRPDDHLALLALADWFEETSRPVAARALRWAASKGLRPMHGEPWHCWSRYSLPPAVFEALRDAVPQKAGLEAVKAYPTCRVAWEALIDSFPVEVAEGAA
jgi:hypothetical protein